MAQVNVELVNTVTGEDFDLTLPDDQETEKMMKVLVEKTGAGDPGTGKQWELWKKGGTRFNPSDTLASQGVKAGDRLALQIGTVAGGRTGVAAGGPRSPEHTGSDVGIQVVPRTRVCWKEWSTDPTEDRDFVASLQVVGDLPQDRLRVCIHHEVYQRISTHAASSPEREVFGVLVGLAVRHGDRRYVFVDGAVPADLAQGTQVSVSVEPEEWGRLHDAREELYPGALTTGWYHTHPGLGVFFSGTDRAMHSGLFRLDHHVALVIDPHPSPQGAAVFTWHEGTLTGGAGSGFAIFEPGDRFEQIVQELRSPHARVNREVARCEMDKGDCPSREED